jgi:hypothetical protein
MTTQATAQAFMAELEALASPDERDNWPVALHCSKGLAGVPTNVLDRWPVLRAPWRRH